MSGYAPQHRHGVAPAPARALPRCCDLPQRAAAAQLDLLEPAWHVIYGVACRRFTAIALWDVPEALRVDAKTIRELRERMREAELQTMRSPARRPVVAR